MKPLPEWQGQNEAVVVGSNTSTFCVLDTCPHLCIATQQPFRELILPMSLPSPQKNNSPRSEPNHFTKPIHNTAPDRCASHPGWARWPTVALLKSPWHANIAQTSCGSLDILPFCAFLPKPTYLQTIIFYIHLPSTLQWFSSLAEAKDLYVYTVQALLWIKWIMAQIYSVLPQTEVHSRDI